MSTNHCRSDDILNLTDPLIANEWLRSESEKIVVDMIIPIVSAFGVFGNTVFLIMIARLKEMRTSLNAFLANLAICDIMFLLFANFWYIFYSSHSPIDLTLDVKSSLGCALYIVTTRIWYGASLAFTTLISVERFYAICNPLKHRVLRGTTRTFKLTFVIWVMSFLAALSLVPDFVIFRNLCLLWPPSHEYQHLPKRFSRCDPIDVFSKGYAAFITLVTLFAAMVVNIYLYVRIISTLHRRPVSAISDQENQSKADQIRNQVARTLIANGVIFFICQTPYRIKELVEFFAYVDEDGEGILDTDSLNSLVVLSQACLFLNSVVNPYLYVFSCQHYRKGMVKAFCA